MFSLRRQLQSTICRWLLDQYLDDCQSWYDCHSIKTTGAMERTDNYRHREQEHLPESASAPPPPKRPKMDYDAPAAVAPTHRDNGRPCQSEEEIRTQSRCPCRYQWPPNAIPVEIFEIITSYLPRAEIKTLRQVCREFDRKASARYFRNVVVPFRSELYSSLSRDENGDIQQHPVSLLSNAGNRIFESFGPHILRFALSLEIDEDALAHPPLKPSQETVPSFWGIYRWPHRTYNRYADLEGIEQTADETQGMKDVMRCLTKVRNLGLCCDAGLGFLIRPDYVARSTVAKQPVFASHDWRRESRVYPNSQDEETIVTVADFNGERRPRRKDSTDSLGYKQSVLEKMAAEAGFEGDQIQEAIDLLLQTEGQAVDQMNLDGKQLPTEAFAEAQCLETERAASASWERPRRSRFAEPPEQPAQAYQSSPALVPNCLSKAQKELILELEWAHRAMIQSFVISTIDNASAGCFDNLTTLTIAKIPSSHVHIFYNDDFWSGLPQLNTVSLGVIADWRKMTKTLPSYIEDQQISPSQAVGKVHTLLNDFIGKQPNIDSLHFEWICGGEFAPSFAQRNKYIIPAPFLETAQVASVVETSLEGLLELPYVKHFSLKNCWVTPHVLWQTIRQMGLASLEKLQLESVSLSACYTAEHQMPLQQHQPGQDAAFAAQQYQQQHANHILGAFHATNNFPSLHHTLPGGTQHTGFQAPASAYQGLPGAHGPAQVAWTPPPAAFGPPPPPPPPSDPSADTSLFSIPKWHFWSGFLEHFSPGRNVRHLRTNNPNFDRDDAGEDDPWEAELRNAGRLIPNAQCLLEEEQKYTIKCISLKSCGRVAIDDSHIATRSLARASSLHGSHFTSDAQTSISKYMQKDCDPMLGRVLASCEGQEYRTLTDVFGLVQGWHGVYSEQMIANARADGIALPGFARFSGVLDKRGTQTNFGDDLVSAELNHIAGVSPTMGSVAPSWLSSAAHGDSSDDSGDEAWI